MPLAPLYSLSEIGNPAYHLRYSWCGWLKTTFVRPNWEILDQAWESDGLRRLEWKLDEDRLHVTVSARPQVSPEFLAQRLKGRLQHATGASFSRKVSVRSLGNNRSSQVSEYVRQQVDRAHFADDRFAKSLSGLTDAVTSSGFEPFETRRGRYWYNLHLVLIADVRRPSAELETLQTIFDGCSRICVKKGYVAVARSIMPDHLHLSLRLPPDHAPESVALGFLNNLSFLLGQRRWWKPSYYVGTFGEYDMGAVRAP